jgi:hypothetical protein
MHLCLQSESRELDLRGAPSFGLLHKNRMWGVGGQKRQLNCTQKISHSFFACSTRLMADPSPLSSATRATKRNLLAVSLVAIAANASNLRVHQILVVGLSIDFENRVFSFLMLTALVIFWVLSFFITSSTDKISNSRIISKSRDNYRRKIDLFERLRAISSKPRT